MSDAMITAMIIVGGTLFVSIITLITNTFIKRFKNKSETQQKEYQSKKEHLIEVYKELISIINLYPNSSPNDILEYVDYAPNYSMEHFDSILKILDYQIEDYKNQLNNKNIKYDQKVILIYRYQIENSLRKRYLRYVMDIILLEIDINHLANLIKKNSY